MGKIMRNVAGIDLSLTSTGWSCGDAQTCIQSKFKSMQRLDEVSNQIYAFLQLAKFPAVVIEGYSFASRNSQAHSIGELGGVVKLMLWKNGIEYVDVPPTVRAKFATGKGNASKGEVMSSVSARTGIVWEGKGADDMCDAWILEEIGRCVLGDQRFDWPKQNIEAIYKCDWEKFKEYCESN
jgi:Holliday junction resolvasome RuvABC endonuclease subunit